MAVRGPTSILVMPLALHRLLEAPELAGHRDMWSAAPRPLAARHGLVHTRAGGADCVAAAGLPGLRVLNHALGAIADPAAVERFFVKQGVPARVGVPEGSAAERAVAARGYERDLAWMKFARDPRAPVPEPATAGLAVRPVAAGDAHRMGELVAASFGLPGDLGGWFAPLATRPGWHCLGAYDGGRLVATGSLFAAAGGGWASLAATDPAHRGRGAQGALLAARILVARRLGLRHVVVETGEPVGGRPGTSWRNILRAGFLPVFLRPFWRSTPA